MTTAIEIPLGRAEDQSLEFKSAKILEQPEKVAREVVGMLNAEGGVVWIGVREEDGLAVEIEAIENAESAKERLWDFLVDTVDPSLRADEVMIETVDLAGPGTAGAEVLRLSVMPSPERKPYAFVKRTAWHLPIRVGARLRPMTREEVFAARSGREVRETSDLQTAERQLLAWREDERKGRAGLWLGAVAEPRLSLELDSRIFVELAFDPRASGNRTIGWHFAQSQRAPVSSGDSVRWGTFHEASGYEVSAEVFADGRGAFFASYEALAWKGESLWPFTVIEFPVSAWRILSRIYHEQAESEFKVVADLALFGVDERGLRPGSPGSSRFRTSPRFLEEGKDVLFQRPLTFSSDEVTNEPDRCGYRLVQRIYRAFGWKEDDMPAEFDRAVGRLLLSQ